MTTEEAARRLEDMLRLEPNWDSYNGLPVSRDAVSLMRSLVAMSGFPTLTHLAAMGRFCDGYPKSQYGDEKPVYRTVVTFPGN